MILKKTLKIIGRLPYCSAKGIIRFYQIFFSPDKGILGRGAPVCRFYPSCSDYALQAIDRFGILKGGVKAAWRILRCSPFGKSGYDPVK